VGVGRGREEGSLSVFGVLMMMVCSCLPACNQWIINVFIDCMHACMQQSFGFLSGCNQTNKEWVLIICFLLGFFQFFGDLSLSLSLSQFFSFLLLFAFALFILFSFYNFLIIFFGEI
jgi:hypothetical protein